MVNFSDLSSTPNYSFIGEAIKIVDEKKKRTRKVKEVIPEPTKDKEIVEDKAPK